MMKDQKSRASHEEVQRRHLQEYIFDLEEAKDRAEEDIQKAQDYLESIFASTADAIGIVDQRCKISQWNKAAEEIYGFTFDELKGRLAVDLYADPREYEAMLAQLRRRGFVRNYDINMKRSDGSIFPCSLSIRVLRDQAGKIKGSITAARDLSEIKQAMVRLQDEISQHQRAQQALRESEQILANIIDFLPDATLVIDKQGKVIAWNKAIEEMTGIKAQEMVGQGNYEYALPFYGERRPLLIDLVLNPLKEVEGKKYAEVNRKDLALSAVAHFPDFRGKETYLFGKASILLDSQGEIIGAVESIRDITDLRKAETERLRFSKLESLGIVAGGIAHDFNNILTAILGNIGLAILEGNLGEQVRHRLQQSERACLQAQGLAQQFLTFAKGGTPIKKLCSLARLLQESGRLALAGSNSLCNFSLPEDLWGVEVDEGQISQVIGNLLINADQAMPEGGIIQVQAGNVFLPAGSDIPLPPGKYVKISITDHGIGIHPRHLDKIFDPYFTTKQKGSGLGLATAYSIIQNHSGYIKVESRVAVGTSFLIYLPAVETGALVAEPEPAPPAKGQGRILVMDDEKIVRDVLAGMLGHLGYEADFANDGPEALEKFTQAKECGRPFAAVILDLTIPGGMGGKEVIRKLLKLDPQVKGIASSGYADDQVMADFRQHGFCEILAKPYMVVELSNILQRVIAGTAN